jgi:uncharacterized protein DUF1206
VAAGAATTRRTARRAAHGRALGILGRIGLGAQGICFGIIGALAIGVATGAGGATTDPQGALDALARNGWTRVLLVVLCFGFAGYAVWRLGQAFFDRGRMGSDVGGLFRRAIQLVQGLAYVLLTIGAVKTLAGTGSRGGSERRAAAGVLGWPAGRELVGFVATVLAVTAVVLVYWALSRRFEESLRLGEMSHATRRLARVTGTVGLCALAVVSGIVAWFLFKASVEFDPRAPVGIGGALAKLGASPYGQVLLGVTAAGLLVFCLFDLLQARYHDA